MPSLEHQYIKPIPFHTHPKGQHQDLFYHLEIPSYYDNDIEHEHFEEVEKEPWIFSNQNISRYGTSIIFVVLIAATLSIEWLLKTLERRTKHSIPKKAFLFSVKSELIGLGTLSFVCILIAEVLGIEGEIFENFEFAHMWMFIFGMCRTVHAMVGYNTIHNMEKKMFRAESQDVNDLITDKYSPRGMFCRMFFGANKQGSSLEYHLLKFLFLKKNGLTNFNFHFAMYIREATNDSIVDRVKNPRNLHWFLIGLIAVGWMFVIEYTKFIEDHDLWFCLWFGYVNSFLSIMIMLISQKAVRDYISEHTSPNAKPANYQDALQELKEDDMKASKINRRKHRLLLVTADGHVPNPAVDCLIGASISESAFDSLIRKSTRTIKNMLKKDAKHPFPFGLSAGTILFWNDMIVMNQCFYFGWYVSINIHTSLTTFPMYLGIIYNVLVWISHLLIVLWSSPKTVLAVNEIHATSIPDKHCISVVKEQIRELNHIRDQIRNKIISKYPNKDPQEILNTVWENEIREKFPDKTEEEILEMLGKDDHHHHAKEIEITQRDVRNMLSHMLGLRYTMRQCKLIVTSMDLDVSGTIDRNEFFQFIDIYSQNEITALRSRITVAIKNKFPDGDYHTDLKKTWGVIQDLWGDELQSGGMKAFLKVFLKIDVAEDKAELIISSMDTNFSDTINRNEFYGFLEIEPPNYDELEAVDISKSVGQKESESINKIKNIVNDVELDISEESKSETSTTTVIIKSNQSHAEW